MAQGAEQGSLEVTAASWQGHQGQAEQDSQAGAEQWAPLTQTCLQLSPGHSSATQQQGLPETGKGGTNAAAVLHGQSRLKKIQRNLLGNSREN